MRRNVLAALAIHLVISAGAQAASAGRTAGDPRCGSSILCMGAEGSLPRVFLECRDAAARAGCGEVRSSAIAAHAMGLLAEGPGEAIAHFEKAIAADPSFVPPYLSLARALLDTGVAPREASRRLRLLLAKAPRTPDIEGLRRRFEERSK